ncbi:MAG: rhodanese-like domain-containing protein [Bacteroidetes bacterium]|jgi:rhodanese-related sulfurtransferase|nr:rhodanese-like domain-containing protein [Bacteroidota bacterium]MDF1863558.1 rhodanese-like domain-containing protein [Saprospiraceae bacterium]
MKKIWIFFFTLYSMLSACAQNKTIPVDRATCENEAFDKEVEKTINFTIPTISVPSLKKELNDVYIFDTRSKEEFEVSHIPNAQYLGYWNFDKKKLKDIPKNSKIVLYCSIGYRSEKIGEQLQKNGFTNVHNLYGSIFEWVNQGNEVVNKNDITVKKVHTYNRQWSEWVNEGSAIKTW